MTAPATMSTKHHVIILAPDSYNYTAIHLNCSTMTEDVQLWPADYGLMADPAIILADFCKRAPHATVLIMQTWLQWKILSSAIEEGKLRLKQEKLHLYDCKQPPIPDRALCLKLAAFYGQYEETFLYVHPFTLERISKLHDDLVSFHKSLEKEEVAA